MEIRNVSSTPVNRPTASANPEAVADTDDSSAPATTGTKSTGAGGYISPFLRYDQGARVAVLLFRDVDTGETQDQIPSQRVVEEYRRAAGRTASSSSKGTAGTRDPGQTATVDTGASAANTDRAAGGVVPVERGISFASFGPSSSTAAAAASFGSDSGAPAPPVPAAPIGGGSFGSAPGGLVSVTV